ncbi:hypothetical protein BH09ACT10_BH09ACT10_06500 [soil metagenome]
MRTTLTIDDDVLVEVRRLAEERGENVGRVLSDLARRSLNAAPLTRNGVLLLPVARNARAARMVDVDHLSDEIG